MKVMTSIQRKILLLNGKSPASPFEDEILREGEGRRYIVSFLHQVSPPGFISS